MPRHPQRRELFAQVPLDLLAAICCGGLKDRAKTVLSVILIRSLGPDKMARVPLRPSLISFDTGISRSHAWDGIQDLLKAGVIEGNLQDGYALVPGWLPDTRRHEGKARAYCRDVAVILGVNRSGQSVPSTGYNGVPSTGYADEVAVPSTGYIDEGDVPSTGCAGQGDVPSTGYDPHCIAPARQKTQDFRPETLDQHTDRVRVLPEGVRPYKGETMPGVVGPGRKSPEALALGEWAEELGCDPNGIPYSRWAIEQCQWNPIAWVKGLLESKVVGSLDPPKVQFLTAILAESRSRGRPTFRINQVTETSANVAGSVSASAPGTGAGLSLAEKIRADEAILERRDADRNRPQSPEETDALHGQ